MKFADYLTYENYEKIFLQVQKEINEDSLKEEKEVLKLNFNKPLMEFLANKRDTEGLSTINFSEGHSTRLSRAWNEFVINKKIDFANDISECFEKVVLYNTFNEKEKPITSEFIRSGYEKLIEKFDNGNFQTFELSTDLCLCHECGQEFKPIGKSWKLAFSVVSKNDEGKLVLVKPESCLDDKVEEVKVNFPSGEIIVTDWVRIDEFTKLVEYNGEDKWSNSKSINFSKGRIFMTHHYAQSHNFVHVNVGNSSPNVFQNGTDLVIGCTQYNSKKDDFEEINPKSGYSEVASVCTDLWGVTMIDKQVLIKILNDKVGEMAQDIVDNYLRKDTNHNIIEISPGDYTLNFHANYYDFNKKYEDKAIPSEIEKFFTLSKTPKLKPKMK